MSKRRVAGNPVTDSVRSGLAKRARQGTASPSPIQDAPETQNRTTSKRVPLRDDEAEHINETVHHFDRHFGKMGFSLITRAFFRVLGRCRQEIEALAGPRRKAPATNKHDEIEAAEDETARFLLQVILAKGGHRVPLTRDQSGEVAELLGLLSEHWGQVDFAGLVRALLLVLHAERKTITHSSRRASMQPPGRGDADRRDAYEKELANYLTDLLGQAGGD